MELRWGTSVSSAAVLLGLLIAWPFVAGAASVRGETTLTSRASPAAEDLASVVDDANGPQAASAERASTPVVHEGSTSEQPRVTQTTAEFLHELRTAGLFLSASGARIVAEGAGRGTARQLLVSQIAADRFGITENPFFDPMRVAVIRDGEALVDLATGVITGHEIGSPLFGTTEVIGTDLLEDLRSNVGWSVAEARPREATMYQRILGYIPVFLRSDEAYATYIEGAQANYLALAGAA